MTRNWQDAHQKGQGFSPQAISQLTGIEVDLATALAGGGGSSSIKDAAGNSITKLPAIIVDPAQVDRTGVSDCSSVLQAYINQIETNRGGQVVLPYGKFYCATGLTCSTQGLELIGAGHPGVTDDLGNGSTNLIVGDGQVGLSLGDFSGSPAFQVRGYRVSNIQMYEKNAGQALGGLYIKNAGDGHFDRVACGRFSAGYGIKLEGSGGVNAQYNEFYNCRVGRCLYGFWQIAAIGTVWHGGQADGGKNGTTLPASSSIAFRIDSGDTFTALGTKAAGFETLWKMGTPGYHRLVQVRCEYWSGKGVWITGGGHIFVSGTGDNSLIKNQTTVTDYGTFIEAGATNVIDDMVWENINSTRRHVNSGTSTRYPQRMGETSGGAAVGNVVGKQAVYDGNDTLIGYLPIYDSVTGSAINRVQTIDADISLTGVTSLVLQVAANVTVGNKIILAVGCAHNTAVTFSATDSQGNTYTVDKYEDGHTLATRTPHAAVLSAPVATGLTSGDTITVSVNTSSNYLGAFAYEYSGILASSPVDQTAGAIGTSTSPSSGATSSTAQAHDLLFASIYYQGSGSLTAGSGYTVLDHQQQAGSISLASEAQTVFATGTYSATGTITSGDWSAALVAYKGA